MLFHVLFPLNEPVEIHNLSFWHFVLQRFYDIIVVLPLVGIGSLDKHACYTYYSYHACMVSDLRALVKPKVMGFICLPYQVFQFGTQV